ncbi:hypothetical protein GCM10009559_04780 [Pseudonocardia zijingensis]|uniref:Secreted protein n=1 Tax=Pseudonocardia zijingensis TaxID=153376 RepID=A0ABP3ZGL4_9PSEU
MPVAMIAVTFVANSSSAPAPGRRPRLQGKPDHRQRRDQRDRDRHSDPHTRWMSSLVTSEAPDTDPPPVPPPRRGSDDKPVEGSRSAG